MGKKVFLPIILGTNRDGRQSEDVANFLLRELKNREDTETKLIDVRDFNFPNNQYGPSLKEKAPFKTYTDTIIRADGIIIVSPEYNHGYPGILKSLIDVCCEEYEHKVVGLVGVSKGLLGGVRAIESLLPVVKALGMSTIKQDLQFPRVQDIFDGEGNITDVSASERIEKFINILVKVGFALRAARE